MKIALFGATGPTGRSVIEEALRQGHSLSVYARDAGKLQAFRGSIDIVVGTLQDKDAIASCLQGCDAVISALGPNGLHVQGDRPVTQGLTHIITAMKQSNIHRLIQLSTAAYRDPNDGFAFKVRAFALLFEIIARKGVEDIRSTAEVVSKSDLEWTLVRIPKLRDGPAAGGIATGWYGKTRLAMKLSRGNLAKFVLGQVSDTRFIRAAPAIADQ